MSWPIAEGEGLVVAGADKTSQDCGCLEWMGCGCADAGHCVKLLQVSCCRPPAAGCRGIRVVKEHSGMFLGSHFQCFGRLSNWL